MLNAIINGKLTSSLSGRVGAAAVDAGLPASSVEGLLAAMDSGEGLTGYSDAILGAAATASQHVYATAYNRAWASVIPFVVLAIVAVVCMKGVRELMTDRVEATVERTTAEDGEGKGGV